KKPYPYEATLRLALPDIRALLPDTAAAQGLNGSASGVLTSSGTISEIESSRGLLHLDSLKLQRGEFRAESHGPWDVPLRGRAARRCPACFVEEPAGGGGVGGAVAPGPRKRCAPRGARAGGRAGLLAPAGGDPADPQVVGTATLVDAGFRVRGQPIELRGLK